MIGFARRLALARLALIVLLLLPAAALAQATVTPGDPPNLAIWQRDIAANSASMTFVSSYTGSHTGTGQCQVVDFSNNATVVVAWTAGTWDSPSAGKLSCTLTVPQGTNSVCWYALQVRDSTGSTATGSNKWGVGVVVGIVGASIMYEFSFGWNSSPPAVDSCTSAYCQDFSNCSSGWAAPAADGSIVLTKNLRQMLGTPIATYTDVDNGTGMPSWDPSAGGEIGSYVGHMDGTHMAKNVEATIFDYGDYDCCISGPMSKADFTAALNRVIGYVYGPSSHMTPPRGNTQGAALVNLMGNYGNTPPAVVATDASIDAIRQAMLDILAQGPPDVWGADRIDLARFDYAHYNNAGGHQYMQMGERIAQALAHWEDPVSFPNAADGPKIAGASYVPGDTVLKLAIQHDGGTGLQTCFGKTSITCTGSGADLCCFRVFVNGVAQTIASTAFNGASEIDLTISGGTLSPPVTYDFFAGLHVSFDFNTPLDNVPYDNQAIPYAVDAAGFPLQPTYGTPTATALGTPIGGMFGDADGREAVMAQQR